jgi:hypothetical protein
MFEWHIFDRNLLQLAIECHVLFWKLYSQLKRIPTPFLEVLWLRPKKKKKKNKKKKNKKKKKKLKIGTRSIHINTEVLLFFFVK